VNCAEAYEAILEAEPAALRGEGDGDLARHLAACASCRERAGRVLAGLDALDRALAAAGAPAGAPRVLPLRPALPMRLAPWGLAAAAALAGVLLLRYPDQPPRPAVAAAALPDVGIEVDLSASTRPAAVIRTADPNITVVWFF